MTTPKPDSLPIRKLRLMTQIRMSPDLTPVAKVVGFAIVDLYREARGYAYPSISYIAQTCAIGTTAAKQAVAKLRKAGFIHVRSGAAMRKANEYIPVWSAKANMVVSRPMPVDAHGRFPTDTWSPDASDMDVFRPAHGRTSDHHSGLDTSLEIQVEDTVYLDRETAAPKKASISDEIYAGRAQRRTGPGRQAPQPMTLDWQPARQETIDAVNARMHAVVDEMARDNREISDPGTFWQRTQTAFRNHHLQKGTRSTDFDKMWFGWADTALQRAELESRITWIRKGGASQKVIRPKPQYPSAAEIEQQQAQAAAHKARVGAVEAKTMAAFEAEYRREQDNRMLSDDEVDEALGPAEETPEAA